MRSLDSLYSFSRENATPMFMGKPSSNVKKPNNMIKSNQIVFQFQKKVDKRAEMLYSKSMDGHQMFDALNSFFAIRE